MKSLKIISMMFVALATVCFTSCMDDDDDKSLTPQEQQSAFQIVKGSYEGDLLYSKASSSKASKPSKTEIDTLKVSWEIQSDSIMLINKFPMKAFAENITDSVVAKAVAEQPDQDMKCYISFVKKNPVMFLINPSTTTLNVKVGDKEQKIQIAMLINNYNSFGSFDATKKMLQMQIIETGIYVDGKYQKDLLKSSVPFVFKATKK